MQERITSAFVSVFGREPEVITRAPGRIEIIGNHTDYNGGPVLGAAIDRGVWVGVAGRADGRYRFYSELTGTLAECSAASTDRFTGHSSWANYPLGVLTVLPDFGLSAPAGCDCVVQSDLPTGAGLSSSAALELAAALAFLALTGQVASREVLVQVARQAENDFVGVPCGLLDQGVSGFGQKDRVVLIDCQGPRFATAPLPSAARFWIFNTKTQHALTDGFYAARYAECMQAARRLGVATLAEVSAAHLAAAEATLSPEQGRRVRHVVDEIARVHAVVAALAQGDLAAVGRLLTASHRSSQRFFENSRPELDHLVDLLTAIPAVYGARLTGGGFGGAVLALTGPSFGTAQAAEVSALYAERWGTSPDVLTCQASAGAEICLRTPRLRGFA